MAEPPIPPAGFICSDKPAGVTSHDVVARYRRELGARTGHAGTLDPFATGLLIVLLGPATRLQRYVLGLPKTYVATARLGWRSTTGDPDGELTETGRIPEHPELPTGRITQTVPMTSAVRVGGERLYKKAHRGETVERPTREVEIHRAELIGAGEGTRDVRDRMLVGHLRPDADRDPRRRLLLGAAADGDRRADAARSGGGGGDPAAGRARRPSSTGSRSTTTRSAGSATASGSRLRRSSAGRGRSRSA